MRAERVDILSLRHRQSRLARVHRTRVLPVEHQSQRFRIPVTSAARTLFDLAGVWPTSRLERAVDVALTAKLVSTGELHRVLGDCAASGRAGVTVMRRLLAVRGPGYMPPESRVEARFFAILDRAGILLPCR